MILISCFLTVGGFVTGLLGRGRWASGASAGLVVGLVPFCAWAILSLAGALVSTAAPVLPEIIPDRPEVAVLALSSVPLIGLGMGVAARHRRSHRRLAVLTEVTPQTFVVEIDKLAALPGLANHRWLATCWSTWTPKEKRSWVSRRMPSLRALHRESAGMGFSRLGGRAADRLNLMDHPREKG
tara:strand:+ start:727 stop:1275 length:549 start_codon:yes stop_codon:yes gene_type:complete